MLNHLLSGGTFSGIRLQQSALRLIRIVPDNTCVSLQGSANFSIAVFPFIQVNSLVALKQKRQHGSFRTAPWSVIIFLSYIQSFKVRKPLLQILSTRGASSAALQSKAISSLMHLLTSPNCPLPRAAG